MKVLAYVGSYTAPAYPQGLHILECDTETGDFKLVKTLSDVQNPTYMALTQDGSHLYTVASNPALGPAGQNGSLVAFRVGSSGEQLEKINEIPTGWTAPCYVALDPTERTLVYAEYACGTAGFANLKPDRSLDEACAGKPGAINPLCQIQHQGEGPNKPRQDRAHAHCAIVTPDGKYELVVDLTLDQIIAYDFIHRAQGLKAVPKASIDMRSMAPGAGPRHILFHPNGKLAFVIFELLNRMASFHYTGENFEFIEIQELLPPNLTIASKAAAIKLSADGTQLFCSNRGYDSITVFNLNPETGHLTKLNVARLGGKFPRDFTFFPGGKFCLVGLKNSWRVASYAYNPTQGTFKIASSMEGIYRPLFFTFKTV